VLRAFALALVLAAPPARPDAAVPPPANVTISLVGTNDLHGHIEALPRLAGYVANLRRARARDGGGVVLVDAGDMFQGTLESNLGEGAAVVRAYNLLAYDAAAVGNHEFDYGPVGPAPSPRAPTDDARGALKARAAEARFPLLGANLIDTASGAPPSWPNVRPTTIVQVAGVKVGIIGMTTMATPRTTMAANFAGLAVKPLAPTAVAAARELRRAGATVVIVVAHAGGSCSRFEPADDLASCDQGEEIFTLARALANETPRPVDAIVAGHTHAGIAHRVAGIPIIESYANGRAFGRIDLDVERARGSVVGARIFRPQMVPAPDKPLAGTYEGAPLAPVAAVAAALAPAQAAARAKREEKLSVQVSETIRRAYRVESPLGNLFADLMRAARRADVALTNGGALREDLPAGGLTYGQLHEAMPFDNGFATIPVTGAELARAMAANLGRDSGILSVSGVRVQATCQRGAIDVALTRPDGKPIAPHDKLTLVTSDFLATGGDSLFPDEVRGRAVLDDGPPIRDAMAAELRVRKAPLRSHDVYDPAHPRLHYPGTRPLRCGAASSNRTK
jgi:2',3'-cyclic-nucleotide 2'-phosphodiesterase (5'-nucleotidase family)